MACEAMIIIIREWKEIYIAKLKLVLIFHGWLSFCGYFKSLSHCWISKLNLRKPCNIIIFFHAMHIFSCPKCERTLFQRQTIVVLPKAFSCSFKIKQKSIFEHFLILWKCWVKIWQKISLKTLDNLDAEYLRSKGFTMCLVLRYGLLLGEERVTQA